MNEDEQISIYARFQLYKFDALRGYGRALDVLRTIIMGMIADGMSQAAITKYIAEYMQENAPENEESLKEEIIAAALLYAAIYGLSSVNFSMSRPVFGHSYADQARISRGKLSTFMQGLAREHYRQRLTPATTNNRFKRAIKSAASVTGVSSALGRLGDLIEQADVKIDRTLNDMKGWQSVAVMDSRTTPLCASLHLEFYPAPQYKTRSEIPNRPPRHRFCRSQLVRAYGEITDFSLDAFLLRNPDFARDFMGQKKHDLWVNSPYSIKRFTDLAGNRLFTNDELVKRYKLNREN